MSMWRSARGYGLILTTVMLVSVPFGYIGGLLSDISRVLPFVLSIVLLTNPCNFTLFYRRSSVSYVSKWSAGTTFVSY